MKNIALSGFMGSGKSTVGKKLSQFIVPSSFTDVDKYISEEIIKCQIGDLIIRKGMPIFRGIETQAIKDLILASESGVFNVLSLGGGAVTIPENVSTIKDAGFKIVHLNVPFEMLAERIKNDVEGNKDRVPFDEELFRALYMKRLEIYSSTADCVIENIGSVQETVDKILSYVYA